MTGAHGLDVKLILADCFNHMLWHDGKLGQLCKQYRIRTLCGDDNGRTIFSYSVIDLVELTNLRTCEGRINNALDAEGNVISS